MSRTETSAAIREAHSEDYAEAETTPEALAEVSQSLDELRALAARVQNGLDPQNAQSGKIVPLANASSGTDQLTLNLGADAAADEPVQNDLPMVITVAPPIFDERGEERARKVPPPLPVKRIKLGMMLRTSREAQGYSLEEVSEETKIKIEHLEAIEESRWSDLPNRTYAVGFVRTYAGVLELNIEEFTLRARQEVSIVMPATTPHMVALDEKTPAGSATPSSSLIVFCVALALFVYAIGYGFFRPAATPEAAAPSLASLPTEPVQAAAAPTSIHTIIQNTIAQAATPAPAASAPAPAVASVMASINAENAGAVPGQVPVQLQQGLTTEAPNVVTAALSVPQPPVKRPSRIKLQAIDQITVQIFDSGGHLLASRVIAKGEAFFIPDKTNYTMSTSNAGGLRLQIDGREMPPLGDMQEPMHNIPLDADELLSAMNQLGLLGEERA